MVIEMATEASLVVPKARSDELLPSGVSLAKIATPSGNTAITTDAARCVLNASPAQGRIKNSAMNPIHPLAGRKRSTIHLCCARKDTDKRFPPRPVSSPTRSAYRKVAYL